MGKVSPDGSDLVPHGASSSSPPRTGSRTRSAPGRTQRAPTCGAIFVLTGADNERGNPSSFELQQDLVLGRRCRRSATPVIIDPITAYMGAGKIDTHKTADVQAVLSPLRDFADQHGVAVIGLTHPSKSVNKAMNAASGSQAFVAASRATWLFARETDEEGQETGRALMRPGQEQPIGQAQQRARLPSRRLRSWQRDERAVPPVGERSGHALADPALANGDGGRELQRRSAERRGRRRRLPSLIAQGRTRSCGRDRASARSAGLLGATYKPFRKGKDKLGVQAYQPRGQQSETGSPGWVWLPGTNSPRAKSIARSTSRRNAARCRHPRRPH
jgi:hypothetical protein